MSSTRPMPSPRVLLTASYAAEAHLEAAQHALEQARMFIDHLGPAPAGAVQRDERRRARGHAAPREARHLQEEDPVKLNVKCAYCPQVITLNFKNATLEMNSVRSSRTTHEVPELRLGIDRRVLDEA